MMMMMMMPVLSGGLDSGSFFFFCYLFSFLAFLLLPPVFIFSGLCFRFHSLSVSPVFLGPSLFLRLRLCVPCFFCFCSWSAPCFFFLWFSFSVCVCSSPDLPPSVSSVFFFFHPPVPLLRSLILSGFIARECQAFETVFKPLLQKRFLGKKAKKAMNNLLKTTPFV